jgi:hypothetical protein
LKNERREKTASATERLRGLWKTIRLAEKMGARLGGGEVLQ